MATSGDHDVNCTVCLDAFKDPRVLPCCHTFCKACLEHMLEKSATKQKLTCPQCRGEHSIPANGFPADLTIASDVAALKSSEQKPPCGECDGGDPAVAYCCQCESYLCEYCSGTHERLKRFQGHNVHPLSSLTPDMVKSSRPLFCPNHPNKSPVVFCKNCQILVCDGCIVLASHEGHKYGAIDTARKEAETKLKEQLNQAETKLAVLSKDLEYIKEVDQQVAKYPDQLKVAINGTFDTLVATLETRRSQLLKVAETSCTDDCKEVWSQEEVVERAVVGLQTSMRFTERVLKRSSDAEFLSLSPQASCRLKDLQGTSWDIEKIGQLEETKLELFDDGGSHAANLQNIGQLRKVDVPAPIVVQGLSPSLPLGKRTEFTVTNKCRRKLKIARPSVKVTYGFSKKERNLDPDRKDGKLTIAFTPTCGGRHSLSVSVHGREVEGNPFEFTVEGIPSVGDRVKIGPDYHYEGDEGDEHEKFYTGTVEGHREHELKVSWDNGEACWRKWGTDTGKYDVELSM